MKKSIGKSGNRLLISIMTAVILLPSLLFISGCTTGFYYDNADKYASGETSFSSDVIEAIDIEWFSGEVNVLFISDPNTDISVTESSSKKTDSETALHYWLDNTTLKIKFAASGKLKLSGLEKTLKITLPRDKILTQININGESSNITLKDIRTQKLSVSAISGNVLLDGSRISAEATVSTTSGNIRGNAMTSCDSFKITSSSGSIRFSSEARIKELRVETTSGNVFLSNLNPAKKATVDTVSGNVELEFLDNSGFSLSYETVNGKLSTDMKMYVDGKKYVYGSPNSDFTVRTASGNLSISSLPT